MKPLMTARKYLDIFYNGGDMESLMALFHSGMTFEEPFIKCATAREYVDALKKDPPKNSVYSVLSQFESDNEACVIYEFSRDGITTPMAQYFRLQDGKIKEIRLIFDTAPFLRGES